MLTRCRLLQIQLAPYAQHAVGASERIANPCSWIVFAVVVAVIGLEVGGRNRDVVVYLIAGTKSDAVAVGDK